MTTIIQKTNGKHIYHFNHDNWNLAVYYNSFRHFETKRTIWTTKKKNIYEENMIADEKYVFCDKCQKYSLFNEYIERFFLCQECEYYIFENIIYENKMEIFI